MASSDDQTVNVLEECRVSPPSGAVGEKSLPLTLFDMPWLHFHHIQSLFFYKFPHPKTHFMEITIPSLKHSLSLALQHFYPFSGNLLFPPNFGEPQIHYEDGDSVFVIFAESDTDFGYLIKNHQREVSHFHPLVPQLPPPFVKSDSLLAPVFAIQVTLFPNSGISIGFTMDHAVADGNSFTRFVKLWGSIHKFQREPLEGNIFLPFSDRTLIKDPNKIGSIYWQDKQKIKFKGYRPLPPSSNILATFLLSEADIQRLKNKVILQCPTLLHVSSFTVTCAYTWTCFIKARARIYDEEVRENDLEHFIFAADCRARMDPPLPENYFGNCIAPFIITTKTMQLIDEDGFVVAANLIGGAIQERHGRKKEVHESFERESQKFWSINKDRLVGIAGSPRFAVYEVDFGLGPLQKREVVSIDETAISLHEGKHNKRDIEVGLSLPKIKMDAFASIFTNGLMADD